MKKHIYKIVIILGEISSALGLFPLACIYPGIYGVDASNYMDIVHREEFWKVGVIVLAMGILLMIIQRSQYTIAILFFNAIAIILSIIRIYLKVYTNILHDISLLIYIVSVICFLIPIAYCINYQNTTSFE